MPRGTGIGGPFGIGRASGLGRAECRSFGAGVRGPVRGPERTGRPGRISARVPQLTGARCV